MGIIRRAASISTPSYPSRVPVKRLIAAELAIGTLIGGTIAAAAPAANAYPGDPMPGCETNFLGAVICDGPIRPDGTFQRCSQSPGSYTGGRYPSYMPPTTDCKIVDAVNGPWPLQGFGPDHHID